MKHSNSKTRLLIALGLALALVPGLALAQEEAEAEEGPQPTELIVTPAELELEVGDSLTLEAEVRDSEGNPMDRTVVFYSRRRRAVGVNPAGIVEAYRPGEHTLIAMVPKDPEDLHRRAEPAVMVEIPVRSPTRRWRRSRLPTCPDTSTRGPRSASAPRSPTSRGRSGMTSRSVGALRIRPSRAWMPSACSPWRAPAGPP